MNLRNKKTGETGFYLHTHRDHKTGVLKVAVLKDGVSFSEFEPHEPIYDYDSLAELNREWEDYTTEEPLIKDKKIRKAVRAWAEANDIRYGRRCSSKSPYSKRIVGWNSLGTSFTIEFDKDLKMYGDSITKDCYNIAELCGEEEQ